MARTRSRAVVLTEDQRAELERIGRSRKGETRRVQRARMLLAAADGKGDTAIAGDLKVNRLTVRNTVGKFLSLGMEAALSDLARSGRPPLIDDGDRAWVISVACMKPKELGYAQELWTIQKLTEHVRKTCVSAGHGSLEGVSPSKVWAILDEAEMKPHRIRYYLERRDDDFDEKMAAVLMVYREVELELVNEVDSGTIAVSFDEKPGIQATANTAPDLPPTEGHGYVARDYEYRRLGTVSLLTALDLRTGKVTGLVSDTHRSADFIEFLKILDGGYPEDRRIRIVLDNHSVHASKETRAWLETRPGRFDFVFTPKHASWLNLVESFFGKLARVCLRGIRVQSKEELVDRIYRYIDEVNEEPVVYRWKYRMDEISV